MTDSQVQSRKQRNKWIHIRVTEAERCDWQAKAQSSGLTVTDLIRRVFAESTPRGRRPQKRQRLCRQTDPALLRELARVGNNLNQIARWANTYKSAGDAIRVCAHLIVLQRQLTDLRQQLDQVPPSTLESATRTKDDDAC